MSTDYSTNAVKVIDGALRVLGVLRSGDTSNSDTALQNDCLEALNFMLKNFQNYGMEQWTRETATLNLTPGKTSYSFAASNADITNIAIPERIAMAYVTPQANMDIEATGISMYDYWGLANKQASGLPNQVAYNFQNNSGTLYVWPVPPTGTNYTMTIIYHKPYDDFDSVTDIPDVPQRWFDALKYNLAVRLAPEFGKPVSKELMMLARETLENAIDLGYEEGSMFVAPSRRM